MYLRNKLQVKKFIDIWTWLVTWSNYNNVMTNNTRGVWPVSMLTPPSHLIIPLNFGWLRAFIVQCSDTVHLSSALRSYTVCSAFAYLSHFAHRESKTSNNSDTIQLLSKYFVSYTFVFNMLVMNTIWVMSLGIYFWLTLKALKLAWTW